MSEQERRRTAYHEAGHAVVGWALGLAITRVWLEDDLNGNATIEVDDQLSLTDRVAICFGSYAGVELSGIEQINEIEFLGDHDCADVLTFHLMPDNVSDDDEIPEQTLGRSRAQELVGAHADAVHRLAEALLERSDLSETEISLILGPSPTH